MSPADLRRLFLLAALWGGSFIYIRVAVPTLGPVVTAEARVLIAGVALLLYARVTKTRLELRARWPQYLVLGALNSAIPFALIGASELHLTASVASILNATSPLFAALLAALWLKEPLTGSKVAGIVIAILGVVVLVGWGPVALSSATLLSIGASLLASLFYGLAGAYTRTRLQGAPPLSLATGNLLGASLILAPAVPSAPPTELPSLAVVLCVLALALLSTTFAYILYFRLVVDVGPARALTVNFLTPIFGVTWGALFLGETITFSKLIGCGIILVGTAFVTGTAGRLLPWRFARTTGDP